MGVRDLLLQRLGLRRRLGVVLVVLGRPTVVAIVAVVAVGPAVAVVAAVGPVVARVGVFQISIVRYC